MRRTKPQIKTRYFNDYDSFKKVKPFHVIYLLEQILKLNINKMRTTKSSRRIIVYTSHCTTVTIKIFIFTQFTWYFLHKSFRHLSSTIFNNLPLHRVLRNLCNTFLLYIALFKIKEKKNYEHRDARACTTLHLLYATIEYTQKRRVCILRPRMLEFNSFKHAFWMDNCCPVSVFGRLLVAQTTSGVSYAYSRWHW